MAIGKSRPDSLSNACALYIPCFLLAFLHCASQTLGFATPEDVNTWLLANPFRTSAALLFDFTAQGTLGYGIQTNSTAKQQRGKYEDPTFTFQVPLQAAAERELARHATQSECSVWGSIWCFVVCSMHHRVGAFVCGLRSPSL